MADERPDSPPGNDGTARSVSRHNTPERRAAWVRYRATPSRVQSESGEVASWLILMAGLAAAAIAAVVVLTFVIGELTNNVVDAADGNYTPPTGTAPEPGNGDPGTGTGNQNTGSGDDPLPVRTRHCSVSVEASAGLLGGDLDGATSLEVIIQEFPDGSQIVTIAGDVSGAAGIGPAPTGAGITINDSTIGAYASAAANAHAGVGGGVQFELAPGESVGDLFVGLAVTTNPITGPISGGINHFFPDTIPTAPAPDTIFVDTDEFVTAGGTAQIGIGIVSAGANAEGQAGINETYAVHSDGTYSSTTTYSGELSGDGGVTGGIPFFAWGSGSVAGEAQGAIIVQTVYDEDFNPVEMIVTTSYGVDGDAILGSDDDDLSITTQQWTLDLTDPDVAAAVENLDAFVPDIGPGLPEIPTGSPIDSWDVVTDNATTLGPLTQMLSTSEIDVHVEAGIFVAGASGGVNGTCTDLQ